MFGLFSKPRKKNNDTTTENAASSNDEADILLRDLYTNGDGQSQIDVHPSSIVIRPHYGQSYEVQLDAADENYRHLDEDLRAQIAKKLSMLVPSFTDNQISRLRTYVFQVLDVMADDQTSRVRHMIAEELSGSPAVPRELVQKLAWDEELMVCSPILEYSPLLSDLDLVDIVTSSEIPGVIEAVARRVTLSESVTQAIAESDDAAAITELLHNRGAHFNAATLELIIDKAPGHEGWHSPLVRRPELTQRTINRIAAFVSATLIQQLRDDGKLNGSRAKQLSKALTARLQNPQLDREKSAKLSAQELYKHGVLNSEVVSDAIEEGRLEFIPMALSLLSGLDKQKVMRILAADSPRGIVALCWKAGLSMRVAMQLQHKIAKIHHTKVINAKNGVDYPFSQDELAKLADLMLA